MAGWGVARGIQPSEMYGQSPQLGVKGSLQGWHQVVPSVTISWPWLQHFRSAKAAQAPLGETFLLCQCSGAFLVLGNLRPSLFCHREQDKHGSGGSKWRLSLKPKAFLLCCAAGRCWVSTVLRCGASGLWVRLARVSNTAALCQLLPVVPSEAGWMQGQLLRLTYLFGGLEAQKIVN